MTSSGSQKIALINKLLTDSGEVPIKDSFYRDHVARRKEARRLALVAGEPSPSEAVHSGSSVAEHEAPSVAEGASDEETVHVDDGSASARQQFDQTPGSKEAIVKTAELCRRRCSRLASLHHSSLV